MAQGAAPHLFDQTPVGVRGATAAGKTRLARRAIYMLQCNKVRTKKSAETDRQSAP